LISPTREIDLSTLLAHGKGMKKLKKKIEDKIGRIDRHVCRFSKIIGRSPPLVKK
jgi:hypothetical protein